ncbi:MAG: cobyrinate a,c-diamide synthase [Acidimicrobiales bacterium]
MTAGTVSGDRIGPRIVVAGVASGVGKTTGATGLMAALRIRGTRVAAAKIGPDFIDPGYHSLATGRPPRNLDPWLCGPTAVPPLAARAARGADLLIAEGVMGLFDGADDGSVSSTADVAVLLDAPVVLVVDAAGMSASIAAMVRGFRDHDPRVRLAGVIANRVGSDRHERLLRRALEGVGVPVLGCLRRDDAFTWRDRHLGLVPVSERPADVTRSLDRLAAAVERSVDLRAVTRVAAAAPALTVGPPPTAAPVGRCRLAVAAGPAFTFSSTDNLEQLEAAGAELVRFDPRSDPTLPADIDGLVVGGGFPEMFGEELADNRPLLGDARRRIDAGLPTWAECGGLLWLAADLDGRAMVGAVPASAGFGSRPRIGYRRVTTLAPSPIGPAGTRFRGHEHHYTSCTPAGTAMSVTGTHHRGTDGFATPTLLAGYVHHHAGGDPDLTEAFVRTCTAG